MKRATQQWMWMVSVALLASASWAQSNTDLPALPPGSDSTEQLPPPPVVEAPAEQPQPSVVDVMAPPPQPQQTNVDNNVVSDVTSPAPVEQPAVQGAQTAIMPETTTAPPGTTPETQAEPEKEKFLPSYGTFETSIFYNHQDIERMKKILYAYESVKRQDIPTQQVKDEFTELLDKPMESIQEPKDYPTYYLSSIVYRSAKDWLFWMNGSKYTPKKMPGGLEVLAVSPRGALFSWKPEYIAQAKFRQESNLLNTSIPRHIRAANSFVKYDKKNDYFTVLIAPNQSFVSGALAVYEGKHGDKEVPTMAQEMQMNAAMETTTDAPVASVSERKDPDAELRATIAQQEKLTSNMSKFAPRNNPNANATDATGTPPATDAADTSPAAPVSPIAPPAPLRAQ